MFRICKILATGKLTGNGACSGGYDMPLTKEDLELTEEQLQEKIEAYREKQLRTLVIAAETEGYTSDEVKAEFVSDEKAEQLIEASQPAPTYEELRAKAYPTVGDQLDVIWKELVPITEAGVAMKDKINKVKEDIPKS